MECKKIIFIIFISLQISNACLAQLDACKGSPMYFASLGVNPNKAYLSTSDRFIVGLALFESEQPGNIKAAITKVVQDPTWKEHGYLGAIATDHFGNSFVLPSAKVNMLLNPLDKQNTIYKVDAKTGKMSAFVDVPMEKMPNAQNPFGLMGSFYDCSTHDLIVSSIAGSSQDKERGTVYSVDILTKQMIPILKEKDIYGICLQRHQNKKILFMGSARESKLYSIELNELNKPIGSLKFELSIQGIGVRGDDKIRKIRFTQDGQMQLYTTLFYYNLTAPAEDQTSVITLKFDPQSNTWQIVTLD